MDPGTLNRRITIQRQSTSTDEAGQPLDVWTDVATVWANVKGQTGLGAIKDVQGNVSSSISRYSFRIRFRAGLDAGMRVIYNAVPFDVTQVRMDFAEREWTDLVCELGGNDG